MRNNCDAFGGSTTESNVCPHQQVLNKKQYKFICHAECNGYVVEAKGGNRVP